MAEKEKSQPQVAIPGIEVAAIVKGSSQVEWLWAKILIPSLSV
jgi:hypothetical protein